MLECFLVPIDVCYELVGRLRRVWRGFDGGQDARREIDDFFGTLPPRREWHDRAPRRPHVHRRGHHAGAVRRRPRTCLPACASRRRSGAPVHAVALRCQVRIEPQRRRYDDAEEAGLLDLFGPRPRWGDTLKPFLWMHASTMVPGFTGSTEVDLPLAARTTSRSPARSTCRRCTTARFRWC